MFDSIHYSPSTWKKTHKAASCAFVLFIMAMASYPNVVSSLPSSVTKSLPAQPAASKATKPWGVSVNHRKIESPKNFPKNIIVMGGPASGKGTQCQRVAEKYGLVHLSTGDMLRRAVAVAESTDGAMDSPYLRKVKEGMESGKLVPDEIIIRLVVDRLERSDCQQRGWILDGFPRTLAQAQALRNAGVHPDTFLFLDVPDDVATKRVIGRRTDPVTGKVYHLESNPPPKNEEDLCQRLIVRSDDTPESMERRLKQFRDNAHAIKGLYRDVMIEINGKGTREEVSQEVESALNAFCCVQVDEMLCLNWR